MAIEGSEKWSPQYVLGHGFTEEAAMADFARELQGALSGSDGHVIYVRSAPEVRSDRDFDLMSKRFRVSMRFSVSPEKYGEGEEEG
jgi:hypothetical protein